MQLCSEWPVPGERRGAPILGCDCHGPSSEYSSLKSSLSLIIERSEGYGTTILNFLCGGIESER
jgi:hypothetical protein